MSETQAPFTESQYRELLRLARSHWTFTDYRNCLSQERAILWRHDIDMSPMRALRLARIEREAGIASTYFILPHSPFYNLLEPEAAEAVLAIRDLGHTLGLHFDPAFYRKRVRSQEELIPYMEAERAFLETVFKGPIDVFCLHCPSEYPGICLFDDQVAGMINAMGRSVLDRYEYVSDSNGYWRFQQLPEMLENGSPDRLHVCAHPVWWTPEPMAPRSRIQRCIDGRAQATGRWYDDLLARLNRKNIR